MTAKKESNSESLNSLIELYLDDALSMEQAEKLDQLLQSSALSRSVFIERTALAARLRHEYHQQSGTQQVIDEIKTEATDRLLLAEAHNTPQKRSPFARKTRTKSRPNWFTVLTAAAAALALSTLLYFNRPQPQQDDLKAAKLRQVQIEALADASFENNTLSVGATLENDLPYLLKAGEVQLGFKNPAGHNDVTARFRGPSTFVMLNDGSIELTQGQLSVHVINNQMPFTVRTPDTTIVDLGTKFTVISKKALGTRVQVSEGMVEVHDPVTNKRQMKLTAGKAYRFTFKDELISEPASFQASIDLFPAENEFLSYRMLGGGDESNIGDATENKTVTPKRLLDVSIRRKGKILSIPYEKLIQSEVISYCARKGMKTGFISPDPLPEDRLSLLSDDRLDTGIFDLDGHIEPLTQAPVLAPNGTPGMGIQFKRPVINQAGPDILLFVSSGGPKLKKHIHVSPLNFRDGKHTFTATNYVSHDSNSNNPSTHKIHRYITVKPASSAESLQTQTLLRSDPAFHLSMATSIDLSDLGYMPGEQVETLFLQDAGENVFRVDVVMIVGLPPILESSD